MFSMNIGFWATKLDDSPTCGNHICHVVNSCACWRQSYPVIDSCKIPTPPSSPTAGSSTDLMPRENSAIRRSHKEIDKFVTSELQKAFEKGLFRTRLQKPAKKGVNELSKDEYYAQAVMSLQAKKRLCIWHISNSEKKNHAGRSRFANSRERVDGKFVGKKKKTKKKKSRLR